MKEKFIAIGKSFLATVIPSLSVIVAIFYGGTLAAMAFEMEGLYSFFAIIILLPMGALGVIAFAMGSSFVGVVWANIIPIGVNGSTHYIDVNPTETQAAKAGGALGIILNLLLLIVTVPLSVLLWLIHVVIIFCRKETPQYYCGKAILISLAMAALIVESSLMWIPVGIQNAVASPTKYAFQVYDMTVGELEMNSTIPYFVHYSLENVKNGEYANGDMIIEVKGSDKEIVVENVSFIPFHFTGDGNAEVYFYVSKDDLETIEFLSTDYQNLRITFAIDKPVTPDWIWIPKEQKSEKYSYQGKYKIIVKEF